MKRDVWIDGAYVSTRVHARERLSPHATIAGPALIEQYDTLTYVPPKWSATVNGSMLIVERT